MNFIALNTKLKALKNKEESYRLQTLLSFSPSLKPFLETYIEEDLLKRIKVLKFMGDKNNYLKMAIQKEIEIKNNNYYYLIKKYCDLEESEYVNYLIKSDKQITENRDFSIVTKFYNMAAKKNSNSLAPLAYFLWKNKKEVVF